jgi:hypothetical protein
MMQEDFASRIRANQEQLSANLGGQFDFIVCGPERPVPSSPGGSRQILQ